MTFTDYNDPTDFEVLEFGKPFTFNGYNVACTALTITDEIVSIDIKGTNDAIEGLIFYGDTGTTYSGVS